MNCFDMVIDGESSFLIVLIVIVAVSRIFTGSFVINFNIWSVISIVI